MSTLREEQLPGIERNAIVAASAGTGKTHLITNIYLAHVLGLCPDGREVPAERIVATTFSRAAAREIRERLELRLGLISQEFAEKGIGLDQKLRTLADARGLSPTTIQKRAARCLELLPRTLIDTLHGLATRVLRTHALEIGLSPGFVILDEHEALEDATSAIEDVLSRAVAAGGSREAAAQSLLDAGNGLEASIASILGLLSLLDEEGLDASGLSLPDHVQDARDLASAIELAARTVAEAAASHPLGAAAAETLRGLALLPQTDTLNRGLLELFAETQPKLLRHPGGRELVTALDALLRPRDAKAKRIRASVTFLAMAASLAGEERGMCELFGAMQREILVRRSAKNALGFGDLLRLARDALRDRPELAAEAGSSLDLLLVDEFQDTSAVQRDLVLLLRERPESARRRSPGALPRAADLRERGLVVVGDRKQSIYAFRGADVSVYAKFAADLGGRAVVEALDLRGVEVADRSVADLFTLRKNYRSGAQILDFVNRVAQADFAEAPRHSFEIRYMPDEALEAPPERTQNLGRVTLIADDGSSPENSDWLTAHAQGPLRSALVAAGFCSFAHAEGRPFRDLALLARRRSTLPLLELCLDRLRIPFVVAGRALYATPEVRDLAALLRLTLDPYDRHALAVVARGPLGGLSDRALAELALPGKGLLAVSRWPTHELTDRAEVDLARTLTERLTELWEVGPRLSPRDMLAFAVERFQLEAVLGSLPRAAVRFGNVGRLLEIAARRGGSLPQFSRWLERQIALDVDESEAATFSEDDDAVRLLTVHGSKGLSFPVTIVLDLGASEAPRHFPFALLRGAAESALFVARHRGADGAIQTPALARLNEDAQARAIAERQRLSYVALTRAEHELVLVLPPPRAARPESLAQTLARLEEGSRISDSTRRLDARALLEQAPQMPGGAVETAAEPKRPARAPWQSAAIGVTAMADFALCPRRFQLLHVVGLNELKGPRTREPEPDSDGAENARALGSAAHRVLELLPLGRFGEPLDDAEVVGWLAREGLSATDPTTLETATGIRRFVSSQYARAIRAENCRVHRELELTLSVDPALPTGGAQLALFSGSSGRQAILRATLDLVVERADGSVDVLDYKRSRGGHPGRYAVQLFAYRRAVEQRFGARSIRTGLVPLLAESPEPVWVDEKPIDFGRVVEELAESRYSSNYASIARPRCIAAGCGFVSACHPPARREASG